MVYLFGKFLNKKKRINIALVSVFGLNFYQIKILCNKCNFGYNCKIIDLSQNQILEICKKIDQNKLLVESQLRNLIKLDIKRLIVIKCFRGFFHRKVQNVGKK